MLKTFMLKLFGTKKPTEKLDILWSLHDLAERTKHDFGDNGDQTIVRASFLDQASYYVADVDIVAPTKIGGDSRLSIVGGNGDVHEVLLGNNRVTIDIIINNLKAEIDKADVY